jgi:NAD(P)-dependent dehydrogenase (short-subunit alcohol dehydrogenase family)
MGVDVGLNAMTGRVELGRHLIRVNSVLPSHVSTTMAMNEQTYRVDPIDISNAVLVLASDESRYITGISLPVDAGSVLK